MPPPAPTRVLALAATLGIVAATTVAALAVPEVTPATTFPIRHEARSPWTGRLTWTATGPDAPDQMTVYQLDGGYGPLDAARTAHRLGWGLTLPTYDPDDRAWQVSDQEPDRALILGSDRPLLLYEREGTDPGWSLARGRADLPDRQLTEDLARAFLDEAGLLPPADELAGAVTVTDSASLRGECRPATGNSSQPAAPSACPRVVTQRRASFQRVIDGYQVHGQVGIRVDIGHGRVVETVTHRWPTFEPDHQAATVPLAEALDRARALDHTQLEIGGRCQGVRFDRVQVAYVASGGPDGPSGAFPVYRFTGTCLGPEGGRIGAPGSYGRTPVAFVNALERPGSPTNATAGWR